MPGGLQVGVAMMGVTLEFGMSTFVWERSAFRSYMDFLLCHGSTLRSYRVPRLGVDRWVTSRLFRERTKQGERTMNWVSLIRRLVQGLPCSRVEARC